MTDSVTIHVPADMDRPIEQLTDPGTFEGRKPFFVNGSNRENPDEFCIALYSDLDTMTSQDNQRASIMALAMDPNNPIDILGDVFMVCPQDLAKRIVDNDLDFQTHKRTVAAFRAWLTNYSESNDIDKAIVFESVYSYATHIHEETTREAAEQHTAQIAKMLGIDPSQIGIVYV